MQSKYKHTLILRRMATPRIIKGGVRSHGLPPFHLWHSFFTQHCISFTAARLSIDKYCAIYTFQS